MLNQVKSFEEADGNTFGDILSEKSAKKPIKIGLFTGGYFEYWRMFPEHLQENVEQDLERVRANFKKRFQNVVCAETVDTLDAADKVGKLFRKEDIDILIIAYGTYLPDFITMHVINQVKNVPVVFFSIQGEAHVDPNGNYESSMRNSGIIGIGQITGK